MDYDFCDVDGLVWSFDGPSPAGFDQAVEFQLKIGSPFARRDFVNGALVLVANPPFEFVSDGWLDTAAAPLERAMLRESFAGTVPAPLSAEWSRYRSVRARLRADLLFDAMLPDKPGPYRCPLWGCFTVERDWRVRYATGARE